MSAARPRTLCVAVTGHRLNQLPEKQRPRIKAEIGRCLDEAETAASEIVGGHAPCVLYSAVAEGADRYAADAALARGWRLITPLPFEPQRYEQDFGDDESKLHFRRLLWASRKVSAAPKTLVQSIGGDAAPYAAVGRMLIEKADLLLCVWNGIPPKGPGGTSEVAALMLEKGGLVLWIDTAAAGVKLVGPAPLPRAGTFRRKLHEALAKHFERVPRPPEMRVA
jgi:hypothetical protein